MKLNEDEQKKKRFILSKCEFILYQEADSHSLH